MAIYIKKYETKTAAIDATDILAPNVTYCEENEQVLIGGGDLADNTPMDIVADGPDKIKYADAPQPTGPEIWVFNDAIDLTTAHEFNANFYSDNISYNKIVVGPNGGFLGAGMSYDGTFLTEVYDDVEYKGWKDANYHIIKLEAPASGELKTYLEANARRMGAGKFFIEYGDDFMMNYDEGMNFSGWVASSYNVPLREEEGAAVFKDDGYLTWPDSGNACLNVDGTQVSKTTDVLWWKYYSRGYFPS